jgi:hypothetical protein
MRVGFPSFHAASVRGGNGTFRQDIFSFSVAKLFFCRALPSCWPDGQTDGVPDEEPLSQRPEEFWSLRMMVSTALVVCLTLVIPAATGVDARESDHQSVVATPIRPLAHGVSSAPKFTPIAGGALRSTEEGFQAFAVEEELKISPKRRAAAPATVPGGGDSSSTVPAKSAPSAGKAVGAPATKPAGLPVAAGAGARAPKAIQLNLEAGADPHQAWNDYFNAHAEVSPADVAQTTDVLMHKHKYAELAAMIEEAIVHDQAQPWMYGALEIALQAAGSPKEELERALMSGVDFASSIEDVLYLAQYMATNGLEERGMKVFRQAAIMDPTRPEPYVLGLKLANRLENINDIEWACLGILSQAWSKRDRPIEESARRTALATIEKLITDGKLEEAAQFRSQYDQALIRDCKVVVSWTGDADVDVFIQEPGGTICSYRNPRTTSGGVMLGDSTPPGGKLPAQGFSETYVCPQAFSGEYRIMVRRVWGKVTAGKVKVDIYSHFGTKQQEVYHKELAAGDDDAVGVFQLADGRRQESLDERRVATAVAGQVALNQAIVAQQLNYASQSSPATAELAASRANMAALPIIPASVGYQPVIKEFPTGANMTALAVISADRRYVRITSSPVFSQIGQVVTFNIGSGASAAGSSGAPGGGAGGASGFGGGGGAGGGAGGLGS